MGKIAMLLISILFLTGCSPAYIEEQKVKYEEQLFQNAVTIEDKVRALNGEFMTTLFSIDKEDDEDILLKLNLYSTPTFLSAFEDITYPTLKNIEKREFISISEAEIVKGFYVFNKVDTEAFEVKCKVKYYQNENLLEKSMTTIYVLMNDKIRIAELTESGEETINENR